MELRGHPVSRRFFRKSGMSGGGLDVKRGERVRVDRRAVRFFERRSRDTAVDQTGTRRHEHQRHGRSTHRFARTGVGCQRSRSCGACVNPRGRTAASASRMNQGGRSAGQAGCFHPASERRLLMRFDVAAGPARRCPHAFVSWARGASCRRLAQRCRRRSVDNPRSSPRRVSDWHERCAVVRSRQRSRVSCGAVRNQVSRTK